MRRSPDGKPIRTKPRPPGYRRDMAASNRLEIPPGWKVRCWAGGAKLTRADATRGLGGGIRNDDK